ncbi:hypothetical protein MSAN_02313800 [Mycena sanguinolenta]|uniref:Uncharacterized protein n=1 Tax=Mycena sanguinolenta TaxID=230812 RepID=A0A8H6X8M0_9AGAR|nr:hypothetical protein MSAN_02313800 [Mycena sanguinolenta]
MANATELRNSFTPLAFLPPALANQFEVWRYVNAATLGAYVWDIGLNLGNDYTLLFEHRVRFPTIVYFLSRACTLAYILSHFIFAVALVEKCNAFELGISISVVLTQSTTAMLFFLRVTAVWHPNKIAYAVFCILWLAVLGAGIIAPLGIRGAHIGSTKQCIITKVLPGYIEVATIMPLVNDTAIFFAISYRILAHILVADSLIARVGVFFSGRGLSTLARALLESGQHFYFVAVATHIAFLVELDLPQLTPVYHAMLSVPGFALINAMACLVFRRIKFGLISSDGTSKTPTIGLPNFHTTANPRSLSLEFRRTDPTTMDLESNTTFSLEVRAQGQTRGFEHDADAGLEISKSIIQT